MDVSTTEADNTFVNYDYFDPYDVIRELIGFIGDDLPGAAKNVVMTRARKVLANAPRA